MSRLLLGMLFTGLFLGFYSCDKEKMQPVVFLANEPGFQVNDTMLALGDTVKVLIDYTWNGKHRIKEIELRLNDQVLGTYQRDEENGQFGATLVKGISEEEIWDFTVTDDGGNSAVLTLKLTLDPNSQYHAIKYYDNIFLGAQSNILRPGFMSLVHATYYNLDGAYQNQSKIDFFFYYDETSDLSTLASAGADVPDGIYSNLQAPGLWTTKRTTYFQKVDMSPEEFYGIYHDGYMIENFDQNIAAKKAIGLVQGDIYMFQLESGQKGIVYILDVVPEIDGEINFALKVQE